LDDLPLGVLGEIQAVRVVGPWQAGMEAGRRTILCQRRRQRKTAAGLGREALRGISQPKRGVKWNLGRGGAKLPAVAVAVTRRRASGAAAIAPLAAAIQKAESVVTREIVVAVRNEESPTK